MQTELGSFKDIMLLPSASPSPTWSGTLHRLDLSFLAGARCLLPAARELLCLELGLQPWIFDAVECRCNPAAVHAGSPGPDLLQSAGEGRSWGHLCRLRWSRLIGSHHHYFFARLTHDSCFCCSEMLGPKLDCRSRHYSTSELDMAVLPLNTTACNERFLIRIQRG